MQRPMAPALSCQIPSGAGASAALQKNRMNDVLARTHGLDHGLASHSTLSRMETPISPCSSGAEAEAFRRCAFA